MVIVPQDQVGAVAALFIFTLSLLHRRGSAIKYTNTRLGIKFIHSAAVALSATAT